MLRAWPVLALTGLRSVQYASAPTCNVAVQASEKARGTDGRACSSSSQSSSGSAAASSTSVTDSVLSSFPSFHCSTCTASSGPLHLCQPQMHGVHAD